MTVEDIVDRRQTASRGACVISHVAASRIDGSAALQVDAQAMPAVVELISALSDVGAEVSETCAVGKGGHRRAFGRGGLLLLELAFVVDVGALSAHIYIMVPCSVIDFRVERERAPSGSSAVQGNVPTVRLAALGDDIDDADVALRLVFCRWGSEYLDVPYAGCPNHLQRFGSREGRRFAIHIDEKLLTAAIGEASVGIHNDSRHSS